MIPAPGYLEQVFIIAQLYSSSIIQYSMYMRCDVCGSNDSVFFIRPDSQGAELHLCKVCAIARGYAVAAESDVLGVRLDSLLSGVTDELSPVVCPACGCTAERMHSTGRLGCVDCATTFKREILSILRKAGRVGTYEGKMPPFPRENTLQEKSAFELSGKLEAAIHAEDFESAAAIRDRLRSLPGSVKP